MRIPWTARIIETEILIEGKSTKTCFADLRRRQAKLIGYVLQTRKLKDIVATGKICGIRDRGRQREKILDSLTK
jgi:hypothetical protein